MDMTRRDVLAAGGALVGATVTGQLLAASGAAGAAATGGGSERVRARDLGFPGIIPGDLPPGEHNAITDVPEVLVGHTTLVRGDDVRTGVTAIRPHGGNVFSRKVRGAVHIGNAFGKLAGSTQVQELGEIESPVVLTNTLSVGRGVDAVVGWSLRQVGNETVRSVNALVGETNDGRLNDIRGRHVDEDDFVAAIESAAAGPVEEGAVGAGTGTVTFGWKGGIGTSSRVLDEGTVGVLVQTNYGGSLTIGGVPVGRELEEGDARGGGRPELNTGDGSCMLVVATDAPVSDRNLRRVAARAVFAMGKTGSSYSNGSGDYAIAFSTSSGDEVLSNGEMSSLFQATLDATEEAIYNALFMATTTTGNGVTVEALPLDEVRRILSRYLRHQDP